MSWWNGPHTISAKQQRTVVVVAAAAATTLVQRRSCEKSKTISNRIVALTDTSDFEVFSSCPGWGRREKATAVWRVFEAALALKPLCVVSLASSEKTRLLETWSE
jgi:hypothetical protein